MTRRRKKRFEIMYAEKAGELLRETWKVEPAPNEANWPDLIVKTESEKFGLEVKEVYLDESRKGSRSRADESNNLKNIEKLAEDYYDTKSSPINAHFLGEIMGHHDQLLKAIKREVTLLSELERRKMRPYTGCIIYLQRLPNHFGQYKRWDFVSDRLGFVSNIDKEDLQKAIMKKAQKLRKYSENISDVRLLLVTDRIYNSGKNRLLEDIICDAHGFKKVYYLSYPEEAWPVTK